jgi:hypothetical protein
MTTNAYIRGVRESAWPQFEGKLWQRSFYEHVLRNEDQLGRARRYVGENPLRWAMDEENPRRG